MKWVLLLASFLVLFSCRSNTNGEGAIDSSVIYGGDDRYPMEQKQAYLANGLATVVKLPPQTVYPLPPELYVEKKVLISWNNFEQVIDPEANSWGRRPIRLCPEEAFKGEVAAGTCSGVLIAPDLVLTAGHCVMDQSDCLSSYWAFDYRQENSIGTQGLTFEGSKADPETVIMVGADKLHRCQKVLSREYSGDDPERLDYALIQLDSYVYDRKPQPLRTEGKIEGTDVLALLGYPLGLPGKIALNATITDNLSETFFLINSDSYVGNSGSPVIHMDSRLLEGILVDGAEDFIYDSERECMKSRVMAVEEGEERITRIESILKHIRAHADFGDQLVDYIINQSTR